MDRATWKKRKPGSDPAYHAPSRARSPRDDLPATPTEGGAGLDSPSVGDPGVSPATQQEKGGAFEGLDQEDQPLVYRKGIGRFQNGGSAVLAEEPRGSGGQGGASPGESAETLARLKQLEAAVTEKDALLRGLEQRSGKLVEAVGEREQRAGQLEAQLEEGKRKAQLLDVALGKLRGMKAALEQREATIEQQRRALEVAERTAEALQSDVSRESARVAAAREEVESVRERGEAKVRELQGELKKERGWNGERALQLVRMEEELSAARREGGAAALAAECAAHAKAQEKLKLLARDHVHLRRQHEATLQELAAQGSRIQDLERRLREEAERRVKREPEPIGADGGEGEQGERRARGEEGGEGGGSVKRARRTSDSSEVLEGMAKWPVAEERSVSHRSLAGEEEDLRADMRRLKEEMAQMKELLLGKIG